jgi:RNA-binding protein
MRTVNSALKRSLRARAHSLKPIVTVADRGLHEAVLEETRIALEHHELIKVRIRQDRQQRVELAASLCERTGAALIQSIGQIVVIYKPRPPTSERDAGAHQNARPSDSVRHSRQVKASTVSSSKPSARKPWSSPAERKRGGARGTRRSYD